MAGDQVTSQGVWQEVQKSRWEPWTGQETPGTGRALPPEAWPGYSQGGGGRALPACPTCDTPFPSTLTGPWASGESATNHRQRRGLMGKWAPPIPYIFLGSQWAVLVWTLPTGMSDRDREGERWHLSTKQQRMLIRSISESNTDSFFCRGWCFGGITICCVWGVGPGGWSGCWLLNTDNWLTPHPLALWLLRKLRNEKDSDQGSTGGSSKTELPTAFHMLSKVRNATFPSHSSRVIKGPGQFRASLPCWLKF